jgi:hypothetical protein
MMLFAGDNAADAQEHRGDGMWDTQDVWDEFEDVDVDDVVCWGQCRRCPGA